MTSLVNLIQCQKKNPMIDQKWKKKEKRFKKKKKEEKSKGFTISEPAPRKEEEVVDIQTRYD